MRLENNALKYEIFYILIRKYLNTVMINNILYA